MDFINTEKIKRTTIKATTGCKNAFLSILDLSETLGIITFQTYLEAKDFCLILNT